MKKCPFCAEEIQDAATVCKHCGRELKKRTSVAAWGCLTFLLLAGVGFMTSFIVDSIVTPTVPPSSPAPTAAPAPDARRAFADPIGTGEGVFGDRQFSYQEDNNIGVFLFEPALPEDLTVIQAAIRHVLETVYEENLDNVGPPEERDRFLVYITARGGYGVLLVRDGTAVPGLSVTRMQ